MEMTFQHICDPCEYLLFDNVCTPEELQKCFVEAQLLSAAFEEPSKTGSAHTDCGKLKKQNSGVFLNKIYTPDFALYSPIATTIHKIIETTKQKQYTAPSQINYVKQSSGYNVLLSGYKNGDYYETHIDSSVLTVLFWFGETVKGGDLIFTSFNHTVPFISNRIVMFPSYYDHQVTKVETDKKGYVRFSATAFLMIDGSEPIKQPITIGTNDF